MKKFSLLSFLLLFAGLVSNAQYTITAKVCGEANSVRLTGPWWGWGPAYGPEAADNGDGTWTFDFSAQPPTENMEYKLVVDGSMEDLVPGGDFSCTPVTDNSTYANRVWTVGSGNVTGITYGTCASSCDGLVISGCTDASALNYNQNATSDNGTCSYGSDLPINFEGSSYETSAFDGASIEILDNPYKTGINTSNKVVKVVRSAVATWAGTIVVTKPVDFSEDYVLKMKVYSPKANIPVTVKYESAAGDNSGEFIQNTTVANQWEELSFDFGEEQPSDLFSNLVIIFNNGTMGDGSANSTYYFDDIRLSNQTIDNSAPVAETVNVTFQVDMTGIETHEDGVYIAGGDLGQDGYLMTEGANNVWSVTLPLTTGQTYLYKFRNQPAFGTWDGFEDANSLAAGGCTSGQYNDRFVNVGGSDVTLDLVKYASCDANSGAVSGCLDTNAINYNSEASEQSFDQYGNLLCIFISCDDVPEREGCIYTDSFGPYTEGFGAYECEAFGGGEACNKASNIEPSNLFLDFETENVIFTGGYNDTGTGFDGGQGEVVENPFISCENSSSKVGKIVRDGETTWAGSRIPLNRPFDFSDSDVISFKIYTAAPIGTEVLLKLEDVNYANNGQYIQTSTYTTTSNEWETLRFTYAQSPTAFDHLVLMFDFGNVGDGSESSTFYFDNIIQTSWSEILSVEDSNNPCENIQIYGCTDINACNFNENANGNDGSCIYPGQEAFYDFIKDSYELNHLKQGTDLLDQGTSLFSGGSNVFYQGSSIFTSGSSTSIFLQGSSIFTQGTELLFYGSQYLLDQIKESIYSMFYSFNNTCFFDCEGNSYPDSNGNEICDHPEEIEGCTDIYAINHNPNSTHDDGSCEYKCSVPENWSVNLTGSNMTIMIPEEVEVSILGNQVQSGSAIGVFYEDADGNLHCGGYSYLVEKMTHIAVMEDDVTTDEIDGFMPGDQLIWKIWDAETCSEVPANANYSLGSNSFISNGLAYLTSVSHSCQTIEFPAGWFMFSTYMELENMNVASVFHSITNEVIIVKNNAGEVYLPEWNYNGLGDLVNGQGYNIKLSENRTLEFCGTYLNPESNPIDLDEGWNTIAYLNTVSQDAEFVMSPLTSSGNLIIIKDYLGNPYLPEWDYNGIGDMHPGQGYQLKVKNQHQIYLSSNNLRSHKRNAHLTKNKVTFFPKAPITGNNMHVVIPNDAWGRTLNNSSEIAAFDKEGRLVGSSAYHSNSVITIWGDDQTTRNKDGLYAKDSFSFKLWENGSVEGIEVLEWQVGDNTYETNKINVVSKIKLSNSRSGVTVLGSYPNPARDETNITFLTTDQKSVSLKIYSIVGQLLEEIENKKYKSGQNQIPIDLSSFKPGTYFYILEIGDYKFTDKLIVTK